MSSLGNPSSVSHLVRVPHFRFHPDPVASGSIVVSEKPCRCCGLERGWIYAGPTYSVNDLDEALCPWCIANGEAHQKYGVTFVATEAFHDDVPDEIVDEISQRTPGFASFQQEQWPSCCEEPGAFKCPAGIREIRQHYRTMEGDLMSYIVHELNISGGSTRQLLESLHRDQSPTAYVFQCRKCDRHFGYLDYV